jgi:hypothetical protein
MMDTKKNCNRPKSPAPPRPPQLKRGLLGRWEGPEDEVGEWEVQTEVDIEPEVQTGVEIASAHMGM